MLPRSFCAPLAPPETARVVTQHPVRTRRNTPRVTAAVVALLMGLVACSEDPFAFDWYDSPDTTFVYSLARPELNLYSGFNFYDRTTVRVEEPGSTGRWDIAVDTQGGSLVLLPPGALGITARGAVATMGAVQFDDIEQAPGDTLLYELNDPVAVVAGTVYVVRTNRQGGSFGSSCVYYAKLEPVVIDVAEGKLTFRYVSSPICNNRELVSPGD